MSDHQCRDTGLMNNLPRQLKHFILERRPQSCKRLLDITIQPGLENKDEVVKKLIEIMSDAGYTAEVTPAGLNAEAPVGTFVSQDKAEDLVKGLIMNLFPNVKEDQVEVLLNTDAAVEDAESYESPYREELNVASNCCGYGPIGELDGELGICSNCKEMAEFELVEDEEGDQEPLAKDTDDARDKGGKLYQGNRHGQYNKRTGKLTSNHERMLNRKSSKSEDEETVTESYTSQYVTDLPKKSEDKVEPIVESVSFKEKYKPKTSWQLEELRRYGL